MLIQDYIDNENRQENKREMAILLFWMLVISWCIALHYFAIVGFIASIERT